MYCVCIRSESISQRSDELPISNKLPLLSSTKIISGGRYYLKDKSCTSTKAAKLPSGGKKITSQTESMNSTELNVCTNKQSK